MMIPEVNEDGTVTITASYYRELLLDLRILRALRAAGVDNWDGYEGALDVFAEDSE